MRIPNKFNGYSRDGIRLYNDPATAAAIATAGTSTGTMAGATLMATGVQAGTTAAIASNMALASGMNLGANLYNGGINSLLNSGASQAATPSVTIPTGTASKFNPASYLQNSGLGNALPATEAAAPIVNPNQGILDAIQKAPVSPVTDAATQIRPTVDALQNINPNQGILDAIQRKSFNPYSFDPNAPQITLTRPDTVPVESITAPPAPTTVTAPAEVEPSSFLDQTRNKTAQDFKLAESLPVDDATKVDAAVDPLSVPQSDAKLTTVRGNMTGGSWEDTKRLFSKPNWQNIKDYANEHPYLTAGAGLLAYNMLKPKPMKIKEEPQYVRPYKSTRTINPDVSYYTPYSGGSTAERSYFSGGLEALPVYRAANGGLTSLAVGGPIETMSAMNAVGENLNYPQSQYQTDIYSNPNVQRPQVTNMIAPSGDVPVDQYTGEQKFADGGAAGEAGGYKYSYDPITQRFTQLSDPTYEAAQQAAQMDNPNGLNSTSYGIQPQPKIQTPEPFVPVVTGGIGTPVGQTMGQPTQPAGVQQIARAPINIPAYQTPEQQLGLGGFYDYMNQELAGMRGQQNMASGGIAGYSLGGYSDGGRLLRGPGDGVSDSIPASIGNRQPARLADGEFVIPARIVSEIGNGSTEAGARKLYAMMDRVQKARKKSTGKNKVAVNSRADKHLPA